MVDVSPHFDIPQGDDVVIQILVDLPDGTPADIAGASPEFSYGRTRTPDGRENAGRPSAAPQIGTATARGVTFQTVDIPMSAEESKLLTPAGRYYWKCRLNIGGVRKTIQSGTFGVEPDF